jgi:hypothetical protein
MLEPKIIVVYPHTSQITNNHPNGASSLKCPFTWYKGLFKLNSNVKNPSCKSTTNEHLDFKVERPRSWVQM